MVESLNHPAYITGQRWDLLGWNRAAVELFMDFELVPAQDRNLLLLMLTSPIMKNLFAKSWEGEAKRMVAIFRATYDLWAGDGDFVEILVRFRQECPEFLKWWETHDVSGTSGRRKILDHPVKGQLHFDTATFQSNDDPSLKLAIYTPA